ILPAPALEPLGGHALLKSLSEPSVMLREEQFLGALEAGHFPNFLRNMKEIHIQEAGHQLSFWAMPDYLSIGSDADHVLLPLSFVSVAKLARAWGMILPTTKMVDAIFQQAEEVYWPRIYPPSPTMSDVPTFIAHSDRITAQDFGILDPARLVAGAKKDLVLSNRLLSRSGRLAIYGWQNICAGENIQPLSIWHGERYVDYSHGIRLIGPWVILDGKQLSIQEVLAHPQLHKLLSREGPILVKHLFPVKSPELARH
ncbi:MAG: hypothetical protein NTX25_03735, partial [Proteobacteria bacterium]|nr:hypothetical protein [Pseudomonadota bacterium]